MADEQRRRISDKLSVPIWVLITFCLSVIVGGAGWINSALQAKADASAIKQNEDIQQLRDADGAQNQVITSNTFSISEMKADIAVIKAQGATNGQLLRDLIARLK